jgi:ABC-2 type transport system ATP-binding protein
MTLALPLAAADTGPEGTIASLHEVTRCFGARTALKQFSLALRAGEVTALLGPNGAGKTTVIRLLLGLLAPDAGRIQVLGRDPRQSRARTAIGAMLQVAQAPNLLTVREHIELFRSYYPEPLPTADLLDRTGLTPVQHQRFGTLSGGQKQRMLFALAMCGNPHLVCLDEPTVGLDIHARRQVWHDIRALAAAGKAVLLTTHYLEEADALAQHIVLIQQGRLIRAGTPGAIKQAVAAGRIRCRTKLPDEFLRACVAVVAIERRSPQEVVIFTHDPPAVLRALLALDATLSELEVSAASLEDAVLAMSAAA